MANQMIEHEQRKMSSLRDEIERRLSKERTPETYPKESEASSSWQEEQKLMNVQFYLKV